MKINGYIEAYDVSMSISSCGCNHFDSKKDIEIGILQDIGNNNYF